MWEGKKGGEEEYSGLYASFLREKAKANNFAHRRKITVLKEEEKKGGVRRRKEKGKDILTYIQRV